MNKLKIFTNHYYPENFKVNELSQELTKYFDVEVVTQIPNYPKGSFFSGYSYFKRRRESVKSLKVKRLPVIPRKSGSLFLMINYLSYIVSSFFYSIFTKDKADYVLVYITSPIFISWAGLRFAKRNQARSTLYLLDLWPGSLISILNLKNERIIKYLEKMCIKIYKRFDAIAVSSYRFIEVLESYGIDKEKIKYIPQHADLVGSHLIKPPNDEGKLRIVFTGNIGEAQGLDVLVNAAKFLKERCYNKVHFNIVGDGRYREQLEKNIRHQALQEYFTFTGFIDQSKIPEILAENDFGFVSLADEDIFNRTLPAKIQSYMSYGIPLLASANGEIPWLIKRANCGYSVAAGDFEKLADLIQDFSVSDTSKLEEMSKNALKYSSEHFNKEKIIKQFRDIMKEGK